MIATRKIQAPLAAIALLIVAAPAGANCYQSEDGAPLAQVQLCVDGACETARLSRACGNIHYVAQGYQAGDVVWLFRVRYHDEGSQDDEYQVLRNDQLLSRDEAAQIRCLSAPGRAGCDFINEVLQGGE